MRHLGTLFGLTVSFLLLAHAVNAGNTSQLVRVYYTDKAELRALANSGADIAGHGDHYVEVVVPAPSKDAAPGDVATLQALQAFERREVIVPDLDALLEPFKDRADMGAYHTVTEVHDELAQYAKDHADICRVEVYGKSFEGRNLEALVIGPQGGKAANLPKFLFMGLHHSREWISVEVPLALAKKLVTTYATDPKIKALVDSRIVWVIPVVNPDGLNYSQTASKMWRKTRSKNSDGSFGVDPNRNYGYEWGGAGASTYPGSDTFRGPKAFSEVETAAIRDLARREKFAADVSFHSYSELILYPWSYDYVSIPAVREEVFKKHGAEMAKFNSYTSEKSSDLYPSSGDTDDFMYGDTGSLSFTFELAQTFIPAESEIPSICDGNVKALMYMIENCSDPFPRMAHTPAAASTAEGLPVDVALDTEMWPDEKPATVTAACVAADGAASSVELAPVRGQSAQFKGTLPKTAIRYHFEYKAKDGSTVRWPKYNDFNVPQSAK